MAGPQSRPIQPSGMPDSTVAVDDAASSANLSAVTKSSGRCSFTPAPSVKRNSSQWPSRFHFLLRFETDEGTVLFRFGDQFADNFGTLLVVERVADGHVLEHLEERVRHAAADDHLIHLEQTIE